eukprot:4249746-Pyramimonas_sp.AAC.1
MEIVNKCANIDKHSPKIVPRLLGHARLNFIPSRLLTAAQAQRGPSGGRENGEHTVRSELLEMLEVCVASPMLIVGRACPPTSGFRTNNETSSQQILNNSHDGIGKSSP